MQELHKKTGGACSLSSQRVANRYRLGTGLLGGLASVCLLLTSGALAGVTTLELSPLIYKSALVAPVDGNQEIGVVLALPSSDSAGLAAFVKHVSTPGDPMFHQYLTTQQFADRFGGSSEDYAALKSWAKANRLSISQESVGRLALTVRARASQFETLFKTQLNTYRTTDGQTFYSASVKPSVPAEIASKLIGVIGLTDGKRLAPLAKVVKTLGENPAANAAQLRPDTAGGTGPGGTYSCTDLRAVYELPEWGSLEKGMICAVFEQGYYNPKDVENYFAKFGIGKYTKQTPVSVDGSPITFEPLVEDEACLDLDLLVGMNPDIGEVKVYIDDYNFDFFTVALVDAFQAMADDTNPPQIVSVSYGEDEGYFHDAGALTTIDTELQQLASLGITVLASSGDNGAFGNGYNTPYNVATPSSDPYITAVGGTSLSTIGKPASWINETAWNGFPNFGATGGGVSAYWPLPDYQNTLVGGTGYVTANGGSATFRNVPDVSAVADPLTGVGIYVKDQGGWLQIGGTSASSPIWAGYLSSIDAAFSWSGLGPLGFFNPILYAVGASEYGPGGLYHFLFNVNTGSNGSLYFYGYPGYTNGNGYSNTTGSGSPWGGGLALQLLISGTQPGTAPGSFTIATVKPEATSCKITWTPSSGTLAYGIGLYAYSSTEGNVVRAFLTKSTSYTLTGLTPSTHYSVLIWGYNTSGGSPFAQRNFGTPK